MKKVFALLIALLMVLSIVACAPSTPDPEVPETKKTEAPSPEGSEDPVESEDPGKKVYKVIHLINGNLGDKSFFDSAQAGLERLAADGRIELKYEEMGAAESDHPRWQETLNEVSESGEYDLVVCGTYQMPDYLKETATAYPDQLFAIYDDTTYVGDNANVVNISYRQNDMGYILGVYAAALTTAEGIDKINPEKTVGFIGGMDSPVINDFLYGFLTGVKDTDPDVRVDARYVNSYADTATAKEMALSMINDNKCDIIWGVAGLSGNGGAEAALESGKAWFFGVDSDQELTLPENQAAITLTSGLKNVGDSLIWLIDEWDAGRTYWGEEVNLGLLENGVGFVSDKNFKKYTPQDVQDKVLAAAEAVRNGDVEVPSAIIDNDGAIALREQMKP
ncbi:MAG: BMP family ABC transporter substrate-binding protein [Clostridiaceae bacterium]|jgi:basic membrane protein A|nr:BMP family ABC transporter substrate-binding protein [Clostridiaceae bacterium]